MVSAVAVAVEEVPQLVLDEEYRIVEVGPTASAPFPALLGRDLWECFPGAEPLFRPYYEEARRTGETVEFVQFYDGSVGRIRATPDGGRLALTWEHLARLETRTLEDLRASLTETIEALGEVRREDEERDRRHGLRLVGAD